MSIDVVAALRRALETDPDGVRAALSLRPCHVVGYHTPEHHLEFVCDVQRVTMLNDLLRVLGVSESVLPHALHDDECRSCHGVPPHEAERAFLRSTWEWAGVPLTEELAAQAPDAWRPGDDEAVAAAIGRSPKDADGWFLSRDVAERLAEAGRDDIVPNRIGIVFGRMRDRGLLEEALRDLRPMYRLTAGRDQRNGPGGPRRP